MKPVEQFHTGNVVLPSLLVQLIPEHTGNSLGKKGKQLNINIFIIILIITAISSLASCYRRHSQNASESQDFMNYMVSVAGQLKKEKKMDTW